MSKEKKPTSIGTIRRANRQRTRQQDRDIDQRHKDALKVLDRVEQRAMYDFVHGRHPVETPSDAFPLAPPSRPIQHPTPDTILLAVVISTGFIGGAIVFSIWLAN